MARTRISVDPIHTLHQRLVCNRRAFVHTLDFVFHGLGWSNPWQWDCEIYFDVPRSKFGFRNDQRPGDVDMLIVPCVGRERRWSEATAIEVKSYGLSHKRRDKSAGDTGRAQVIGLANMGFPYVGLLHVVPVERGIGDELRYLPLWHTDKPYSRDAAPETFVLTDTSAVTFYLRQRGRLERVALPECAGVKVFALTLDRDRRVIGTSIGHERAPALNPNTSEELVRSLPIALSGTEAVRVGFSQPRFRVRPRQRS